MICAFSGSCETAGQQPNAGDQEPCLGTGNAGLDVLGEVAVASLDSLSGVKPTRAAAFRGLGALAIDDAGRRNDIAPQRRPGTPHQRQIDPTPDAPVAPVVEVVLNSR